MMPFLSPAGHRKRRANDRRPCRSALLLSLVAALAACAGPELIPLGRLYQSSAQNKLRNPVVLIPGITGSRLVESGSRRVVWGAFTGHSVDPETAEGLRDLALPVWQWQPGWPQQRLAELQDDIEASGPLDKVEVEIMGVPLSVNVYLAILNTLGLGGFRQSPPGLGIDVLDYGKEHYTCFTFFYDWRRDNVANAVAFGEFLEKAAAFVEKQDRRFGIERGRVRFDVVAHSMGGLIARYYLRFGARDVLSEDDPPVTWAGADRIARLVLIGTPNLGSLEALRTLLEGKQYSVLLPRFQPALMATFPSLYQLLPRARHRPLIDASGDGRRLDPYSPELWLNNAWGAFSEEQAPYRRQLLQGAGEESLRAFVTAALERARRFVAALDKEPGTECPADVFLFASRSIPTPNQARVYEKGGRLEVDFSDGSLSKPGDGTVTFASAVGDERTPEHWGPWLETNLPFKAVYLFDGDHLGMTRSRSF
ncbi:MAG: hypothetical protein D6806_10840, partial [Deltaproteobacteria bacterium]